MALELVDDPGDWTYGELLEAVQELSAALVREQERGARLLASVRKLGAFAVEQEQRPRAWSRQRGRDIVDRVDRLLEAYAQLDTHITLSFRELSYEIRQSRRIEDPMVVDAPARELLDAWLELVDGRDAESWDTAPLAQRTRRLLEGA